VTSAACAYFHAPLGRLTVAQYALLAGMTQAPSIYDPTINPDAAAIRRSHVLQTMLSHHLISAEQAAAAELEPVVTAGPGC
jgi:membrane peptidoglycan carboxypeptidase